MQSAKTTFCCNLGMQGFVCSKLYWFNLLWICCIYTTKIVWAYRAYDFPVAFHINYTSILIMRGRLYCSFVRTNILHGGETWPVRKENKLALQSADMRMVIWLVFNWRQKWSFTLKWNKWHLTIYLLYNICIILTSRMSIRWFLWL